MSDLEDFFRVVCADPAFDMLTFIRSPRGGWQVSVKRAYRGHNVHHAADPVAALMQALTAPALAPVTSKPPVAAALPAPAVDEDLFG